MSEISLKAKKIGSTISFYNKSEYTSFLSEIVEGTELIITISRKRSLNQNALFHKWISIIADYMGESPEAVKVWLVCKFFGCNDTEIDGKTYTIPVSTSKLNKKEFANGMNLIELWALQELSIKLPSLETL